MAHDERDRAGAAGVAGRGLLDLLEPVWRLPLTGGSLAGEIEVEAEVRDAVARGLGERARGRGPGALARRWPACVVVALAHVAADSRRDGEFWTAWCHAVGTGSPAAAARQWGAAFLTALGAVSSAPAPVDASSAIWVHAAIPTRCLDAVMRSLAAGESLESVAGADPAIRVLADSGGPAARRLLDRCRELVRRSRDEGEEPAEAEFGLSRRYVDAARRAARTPPGTTAALRLDPYGRGVLRRRDAADGPAGEESVEEAVGPDDAADPSDPLLLFAEDGTALRGTLPPDAVWALHPAARSLRSDVAPRVLVESRMPLSWRGWHLVQLDLGGVGWLELDEPNARRRVVREHTRPRVVLSQPLAGVATVGGLPVHAALPSVCLPADTDGRWRVEVRRSRKGQRGPVVAAAETTAVGWRPERLWAGVPRPLLGELVVAVTPLADSDAPGPAHRRGLRRVIAVAEGLEVQFVPGLRLTGGQGPEPADAVLLPAPGMTVSPAASALGEGEMSVEVVCVAGSASCGLALTPPHLRVRVDPEPGSAAAATPWHERGPLRLAFADLLRGGALRLDLPGIGRPPPMQVMAADRAVQVVEPTERGRYPLRRLLDTVTAHGAVEMRITLAGRTAIVAQAGGPADPDAWGVVDSGGVPAAPRARRLGGFTAP